MTSKPQRAHPCCVLTDNLRAVIVEDRGRSKKTAAGTQVQALCERFDGLSKNRLGPGPPMATLLVNDGHQSTPVTRKSLS